VQFQITVRGFLIGWIGIFDVMEKLRGFGGAESSENFLAIRVRSHPAHLLDDRSVSFGDHFLYSASQS
jgi:hypothetical protein